MFLSCEEDLDFVNMMLLPQHSPKEMCRLKEVNDSSSKQHADQNSIYHFYST